MTGSRNDEWDWIIDLFRKLLGWDEQENEETKARGRQAAPISEGIGTEGTEFSDAGVEVF
jgi:hypothetical protein